MVTLFLTEERKSAMHRFIVLGICSFLPFATTLFASEQNCQQTSFENNSASNNAYASKDWWNAFWTNSEGWGEPNGRVMSVIESLDGSKQTISIVDIGAGNGRHSILSLLRLFEKRIPKSHFTVHCFDYSKQALEKLRAYELPKWLHLVTHEADINTLSADRVPKADLLLLYGILEYVEDKNLSYVLSLAAQTLHIGGYLVVVTLVQGPGALVIESETTRDPEVYTQYLAHLDGLKFVDTPTVTARPDRHDLGKGYPEDHLHYVFRSLLKK